MKISFHTLGCKVNQYESQAMEELLCKENYSVAGADEVPDVFILHSCAVTAESVRKSRQLLRKYRALYPKAIMVFSGCYPQAFPDLAKTMPEADIIIGNKDLFVLPALLKQFNADHTKIVQIDAHQKSQRYCTPSITKFSERTRAYIKIQDGCNRFCSYCIIPTARGRVRSRAMEDIRQEIERVAANGFTEIVFTGINLSAFGQDTNTELCDAVAIAAAVQGIERIRLGSLEPDQISDRTLDYLAQCNKFCPQFHLSLQSGCDSTLKRMNRHYDSAFYADLVARIRSRFTDASITTDIIVGFPGESEADFITSMEFARSMCFAKAHVFPFSGRAGTRAYTMEGQIDKKTKTDRCHRMIQACAQGEQNFLQSQVGKRCKVLFETHENGFYTGYSENYMRVQVASDIDLQTKLLSVEITDICGETATAKLVDQEAVWEQK